MKKIFYSFLPLCLLGLSYSSSQAQSFTVEQDTVEVAVYGNLNAHNNIKNITSANIQIEWKVTATDLPAATWGEELRFGICDNALCRTNFQNQILNGTAFTSVDYVPNTPGDFHVQLQGYDNSAVPPGTHYLTVNLKEVGGTYSKDIVFVISKWATATSINTVSKSDDNISLYPNPAKSVLNVSYDANLGVKNIAVYNLVGKQISSYKVSGNEAKLNIDNTPSGIYFVRLVDNAGRVVATRRFTHQ